MDFPASIRQQSCRDCLSGQSLGFDIRMAFQPIVEPARQAIFGYEALVRGPEGQGAAWVFAQINKDNRYYFDQACRVKAIETAARLRLDRILSINFMPNAVYKPENCIRATLEAADLFGFDIRNIMFEVVESERISDQQKLKHIFDCYTERGFLTAIDDYGSGFAKAEWLISLQPDVLKLDMALIRDINQEPRKQARLRSILELADQAKTRVLAEGIESPAELSYLQDQGIELFQGYWFAKPHLEQLVEPRFR